VPTLPLAPRLAARTAVVLLAAWALTGCVSAGHKFEAGNVPMLRVGETTQAEVREFFGPPWRTGLEDGQRTWTYGYYRYSLFAHPTAHDLVVRFDDAGRVDSYTYSSTLAEPGS
jgi:outer membrane protein assembly factor BamE (lipoprotein component of BamABCDE complex)